MTERRSETQSGCPDPQEIVAYIRNELELCGQARVHDHLAGCPSCHAGAEVFRAAIKELESADDEYPAHDLASAVLARIPDTAWQEDDGVHARHRVTLPALMLRLAACVVVVVGLSYTVYRAWQGDGVRQADGSPPSFPVMPDATEQRQARKEGLDWLVRAQDSSGKWDTDQWGGRREYTVSLTGMALLSLVRSDNDFPEKSDSMRRAVEFLLRQQERSGRFGDDFDGTMYNHGIATVALLEIYAKKEDPDLEPPLRKALDFVRAQQLPFGGWGYRRRPGETANTSISTWSLQALLLSVQIGWDDEGYALRRGLAWLVTVVDDQGQFGYQRQGQFPHGSETLTAMGAYCLFKASKEGIGVDRQILRQVEQDLLARLPERPKIDFYRTYFQVRALKEIDKGRCADSLDKLQRALLSGELQSGPNKGSWNPQDRWGSVGGRIYSTALAALALDSRSAEPM